MAYHHHHHHHHPLRSGSGSTGLVDTTYTKVFVGGLAWETQSDTMRRYFEQFGDIVEAVVISDKNTGRSKGYGFVTFGEAEGARRACMDPCPVIDGRRANCNLASLGRPPRPFRPPSVLARPSFGYHHHQPLFYPPNYGYTAYGPEYVYHQGGYNPYGGQQYVQIYGGVYPYGQGVPSPSGQGYTSMQGYAMPAHHQMLHFGGPSVTTSPMPAAIQTPYPTGMGGPVFVQPQFMVPAPSQYAQGGASDQSTG